MTRLPLVFQVNAGRPEVDPKTNWEVWPLKPAAFGQIIVQLVTAGASMVGGCCGTTPEHIAEGADVSDTLPHAVARRYAA